jgi:hypothetical protein
MTVQLVAMSSSGDVFISEDHGTYRVHLTLSDQEPKVISEAEAQHAPAKNGLNMVNESFASWLALDARRQELVVAVPRAPSRPPVIEARSTLGALHRFSVDPTARCAHSVSQRSF